MTNFFISGTDTNIGKTMVSSLLMVHAKNTFSSVKYIKPIQTGIHDDCDADFVAKASRLNNAQCQTILGFSKPLSPHLAAHYQSSVIDIAKLKTDISRSLTADFNIVEGAGGLMVPLTNNVLLIDLIGTLNMPVILVASSRLGTINHTLLSLEALRARRIAIAGVVLSGPPNKDNEASIKYYGKVERIFSLPMLAKPYEQSLALAAKQYQHHVQYLLGNNHE